MPHGRATFSTHFPFVPNPNGTSLLKISSYSYECILPTLQILNSMKNGKGSNSQKIGKVYDYSTPHQFHTQWQEICISQPNSNFLLPKDPT